MSCNTNISYSCTNPCAASADNTAECETLPSQIQNFTDAFFGSVVKTEVDGEVVWTLPCSLDVGLPNNPRAEDEGLACYFLRLFQEGIIGLEGPAGEEGAPGADGRNAYTVTLASFVQPSLISPNVTITVAYNPAIALDSYVFIHNSGWYLVTNVDPGGSLSLTCVKLSGGTLAGGTVTAGKIVVLSGYPGSTVIGPTGPTGPSGPTGAAGTSYTTSNDQVNFEDLGGANFDIPLAFAEVDFVGGGAGEAAALLLVAGKYLITCSVDLLWVGVTTPLVVDLELRHQGTGLTLPGSSRKITVNSGGSQNVAVTIAVHYTTGAASYVKLRAQCSVANEAQVVSTRGCINFMRIE